MQIINIGPYPPPFGGVSSHLIRLKNYFETTTTNYTFQFLDNSKIITKDKLIKRTISGAFNKKKQISLFFSERSIVHFHYLSGRLSLLYTLFLSFRHIVVISFHNELFVEHLQGIAKTKIGYRVSLLIVNRYQAIIVDNKKCELLAQTIIDNPNKIVIIPEFIPPITIPPISRENIIALRNKHRYLLASNAFQITFHDNVDLYGIDLLIEALNSICNTSGIDAVVVFLLPNIGDENYFLSLKRKIRLYNLEDRFLFITDPLEEASSLWKIADVVIRATNTDGNSVSVLEALNLGVPVCASDCVERPAGVRLFKTRNVSDLTRTIISILSNDGPVNNKEDSLSTENNAKKILSVYDSLQKGTFAIAPLYRSGLDDKTNNAAASDQVSQSALIYFDQIGAKYSTSFMTSFEYFQRYKIWKNLIIRYCKKNIAVQDWGCGPGALSFFCATITQKVTGFDGSSKMIALCNERKTKEGITDITFVEETLPPPPNKYNKTDLILCSSVIEYILQYHKFIDSINNHLNDGGYAIISFPNRQSIFRKYEKVLNTLFKSSFQYQFIRNIWSLKQAVDIFKNHGFSFIEAHYYSFSPLLSKVFRLINIRLSANLIAVVLKKTI